MLILKLFFTLFNTGSFSAQISSSASSSGFYMVMVESCACLIFFIDCLCLTLFQLTFSFLASWLVH